MRFFLNGRNLRRLNFDEGNPQQYVILVNAFLRHPDSPHGIITTAVGHLQEYTLDFINKQLQAGVGGGDLMVS